MKNRAFSFVKERINILIFLAILFLSYIILDITKIEIPCIFHKITTLYCPGCGNTRMIKALIKLDFYQAFRYNPLCFILLWPSLILFIDYVIKKKDRIIDKIPKSYWMILAFILIVYGLLRNIQGFEYLRPTDII